MLMNVAKQLDWQSKLAGKPALTPTQRGDPVRSGHHQRDGMSVVVKSISTSARQTGEEC